MIVRAFLFFLLSVISLRADDLLPCSELNQISVKTIPAYTAIEAEVSGNPETAWESGFRQDTRYLARINSPFSYPILISYPEEGNANSSQTATLVQLIVSAENQISVPKEKGLQIVQVPSTAVACYAYRGAYTSENYKLYLGKILAHLKEEGISQAGPPRHLLYSNTSWIPSWWRVSEIQVPISEAK
jgi:effector-binding domain-containing protein